MTSAKPRRWIRWVLIGLGVLLLVLVLGISAWVFELTRDHRDDLIARHGQLIHATVDPAVELLPGVLSEEVHLRNDQGLEVDLRLVRPAGFPERPMPVLVLIGGHRTGRDAVELIGDPGDMVVAAIDYPYRGPHRFDSKIAALFAIRSAQRGLIDAPPALSLALDWLLDQPWTDDNRAELAGVSLGVPVAAVAGALDTRFRRVWLLHGGADNYAWMEQNLSHQISYQRIRSIAAPVFTFLAYGEVLDAGHWVAEISPRELVLIASYSDERLPRECVEKLYRAAREPVELIWTTTGHIQPSREDVINELRELTLTRILDD